MCCNLIQSFYVTNLNFFFSLLKNYYRVFCKLPTDLIIILICNSQAFLVTRCSFFFITILHLHTCKSYYYYSYFFFCISLVPCRKLHTYTNLYISLFFVLFYVNCILYLRINDANVYKLWYWLDLKITKKTRYNVVKTADSHVSIAVLSI